MGLDTRKPVFRVSDKVRVKPAAQLHRVARKLKFPFVKSLDKVLSSKQISKALIRLHRCAGWSEPVLFANPNAQR